MTIKKHDIVKIAAWTDLFMRGETIGTVTKVGRTLIHVRGQRSGKTFKFRKQDPYDSLQALTPVGNLATGMY